MRTVPKIKLDNNAEKLAEARFKKIAKIAAIVFILLVQLAIIYKMIF